ncbi:hypothetical protein C0585_02075 [Candidatus Woesearchaeota archaeon]|nr:MAG: hypothetical protein C0585_02075 [Candidatus Woesearchaeota archaeon]
MKREIMYAILIALMAFNVFAIGVTPSRLMVDYEEGKVINGEIRVANIDSKDLSFVVYPSENLAPYIQIENQNLIIDMKSDDFEKTIKYKLTLPKDMEPGQIKGGILVSQLIPDDADSNFITSTVTVNSQIVINVPYPGKYVKAEVQVTQNKDGVLFNLPVFNLGNEQIDSLRAIINIKSIINEDIVSIDTNTISLNPSSKSKISAVWNNPENKGKYVAEVILLYDGNNKKEYKEFEFGETSILIKDFSASDFRLGAIARFDIKIRNNWNERIDEVNAELTISKEGSVIDVIKSADESVAAYDDVVLSAFWDTAGLQVGNYNILTKVLFDGKIYEEPFDIYVSQDKIITNKINANVVMDSESGGIVKIMIGVSIIFAILIVVLIFMNLSLLKNMKKK